MNTIKYPIKVSKITVTPIFQDHNKPRCLFGGECGDLVSVAPCGEKYKNKTYLGFLLGELPLNIVAMHTPKTKELEVFAHKNPAMFVPELKEIIWGCGSWWHRIENEKELRKITKKDINNVWYVKALNLMLKKKK